jgi:hypothetical protein
MRYIAGILFISILFAQDTTHSTAFKSPFRYSGAFSVVRPSEVTYQLWEGFSLVRKANAGDPEAMHELAIRYLTAQGFTPDTTKAFELILKAAESGHLLASFNAGVFYYNGWGTEWNPFSAFKHFRNAAMKGTREGAFAYALFFTDNLTVRKDIHQAYYWMKISADKGYPPAKDLLIDIERYRDMQVQDSVLVLTTPQTVSSTMQFEPVDFNTSADAEAPMEKTFNIIDLLKGLGSDWAAKVKNVNTNNDSTLFQLVLHHAEWGIPEEFTIIGRCYEQGIGVRQDSVKALLSYLRAVRLESRRAPALLLRLIEDGTLLHKIRILAGNGNAESQYIIATFALSEMYPGQKHGDIISFLQSASRQLFVPALNELGTIYFSGQIVPHDRNKALEYWERSSSLGSNEARVRLASAKVLTGIGTLPDDSARSVLLSAMKEGSIQAQIAVAYLYENGIGSARRTAEAVKLYRLALQRGNRMAYPSLQRVYDSFRPKDDPEFHITQRND